MFDKFKRLLRAAGLVILLGALIPVKHPAHAAPVLPPVDMFQLPWERGIAWVTLDVFDNGTRRHLGSPHHYLNGGAIDFAPRVNMRKGEDTSNAWVTAAAAGTVVEISKCHLKIAHANAWITEYQHLANFQVKLGDVVAQNQRLAVIANAGSQPVCLGSVEMDIPHLHFSLRPNMVGATFAGWVFNYNSFFNVTTFTRDGVTVGQYAPLLNAPGSTSTTPGPGTLTAIASATSGAVTPTPAGPHASTTVDSPDIPVGGTALVTVRLNNVPVEGYTSAEFTCNYNPALLEASNIVIAGLFGADAATAINGPQNGSFIVAIAGSKGNKATADGVAFTFNVKGLTVGQTAIVCSARVSQGNNLLVSIPSIGASITVLGSGPTPTITPPPPASPTLAFTPTPTVPSDWLTFTNLTYGFEFKYPPEGVIAGGRTVSFARIDLPFAAGTNLREKYLEAAAVVNANPCRSPVAASSMVQSSESATINGIPFLKETGGDAGAGNIYQFEAYSTQRDDVCVSLSFVLHSLNPGNFATPPPVFDYAAEAAVFAQIVSTYRWLVSNTATPDASGPGDRVPSFSFVSAAGGLSQPVFVTHASDGSGRLFVLERAGRVRVITAAGSLLPSSFLDITSLVRSSGSEEGLLGLVFHPNYESNGLFFVAYTNTAGDLTLARYSVSSDPNAANPVSAVTVLNIPHPTNTNHNGGMLAFGDDGYLYWSTGDGGGGGDVPNNAQNTNVLLGKILRLDVNSGSPYGIPSDNPFVGVAGARAEIWDYGFRNPWRFSFDRGTGDLYIGDVGEGAREEIDHEPASSSGGLNYGWRVMEGTLCFNPPTGCDPSGKVLPVAEYANDSATCAVTGGYVYRGSSSPQMAGIYFYGDFCSGEVWGLLKQASGAWDSDLIMDTPFLISSFGEDEAGELYLTDYGSGSVYRILGPSGFPTPAPTSTSLSVESPTPSITFTPVSSPTPTPSPNGTVTGQVIASKPVTVSLMDAGNAVIASVTANPDGSFSLTVPAGTYTVSASADGHLDAQGTATLTAGNVTAMPVISLPAGDIDGNDVIDQFDAMTIGMNYNASTPAAADLNNDGIVNVLDLERLAQSYRKTGPVPWQ
jgi:glucose/arabinose dehydrogenase